MSHILRKGISLGLLALVLLALPLAGALAAPGAQLTNAPTAVATTWSDALPVVVTVTDAAGGVQAGTVTLATNDVAGLRFGGTVDLDYEYGATNMPVNILYHALLGMNPDALIRVEGSTLEDLMDPGLYTVAYAYGGQTLTCTVRVRGAIIANVTILDDKIPLSGGEATAAAPAAQADVAPEDVPDDDFVEPIPEVTVAE